MNFWRTAIWGPLLYMITEESERNETRKAGVLGSLEKKCWQVLASLKSQDTRLHITYHVINGLLQVFQIFELKAVPLVGFFRCQLVHSSHADLTANTKDVNI